MPTGEPPKNWLWANILGILGCTPLGVIGLVFAIQVNSKWQMGDYGGAEQSANTAKIMGIIGLVAFILQAIFWVMWILLMILGVIGAAAAPEPTYDPTYDPTF